MQIHEITLIEDDAGTGAFSQISQQLQKSASPTVLGAPKQSSTRGTTTQTTTGLVHAASARNLNPQDPLTAQQKWDVEYRRLQNQFPGRNEKQYQAAMLKRMGTARPAGQGAISPAPVQPITRPATQYQQPAVNTAPSISISATYPPITIGAGPQAQVFVNKGSGYVDQKTGKPMPPAIVKAMGI
jgi:hypothetical protein